MITGVIVASARRDLLMIRDTARAVFFCSLLLARAAAGNIHSAASCGPTKTNLAPHPFGYAFYFLSVLHKEKFVQL